MQSGFGTTEPKLKQFFWRELRRLEIEGTHFRRQVVLGPYIADFACLSRRLVIEVDGSQHGTEQGLASDAIRTRWLEAEGYRLLRFWNSDVMSSTDSVMDAIYDALTSEPDTRRIDK